MTQRKRRQREERCSLVLEEVEPNNQHEVGGEVWRMTTEEGQMPCGQRLGEKDSRGETLATFAGGEVVSLCT